MDDSCNFYCVKLSTLSSKSIFPTGAFAFTGRYTESFKSIYINDLNCNGSEESVWECSHNRIEGYSCNHRQDASVMCQGTQFG